MRLRNVSQGCGYASLACLAAALAINASPLSNSWDGATETLVLSALVLPLAAALTGSKAWLLVWLIPLIWLLYVLATTPLVRM